MYGTCNWIYEHYLCCLGKSVLRNSWLLYNMISNSITYLLFIVFHSLHARYLVINNICGFFSVTANMYVHAYMIACMHACVPACMRACVHAVFI